MACSALIIILFIQICCFQYVTFNLCLFVALSLLNCLSNLPLLISLSIVTFIGTTAYLTDLTELTLPHHTELYLVEVACIWTLPLIQSFKCDLQYGNSV